MTGAHRSLKGPKGVLVVGEKQVLVLLRSRQGPPLQQVQVLLSLLDFLRVACLS